MRLPIYKCILQSINTKGLKLEVLLKHVSVVYPALSRCLGKGLISRTFPIHIRYIIIQLKVQIKFNVSRKRQTWQGMY